VFLVLEKLLDSGYRFFIILFFCIRFSMHIAESAPSIQASSIFQTFGFLKQTSDDKNVPRNGQTTWPLPVCKTKWAGGLVCNTIGVDYLQSCNLQIWIIIEKTNLPIRPILVL